MFYDRCLFPAFEDGAVFGITNVITHDALRHAILRRGPHQRYAGFRAAHEGEIADGLRRQFFQDHDI